MATQENPPAGLPVPQVPVAFVPAEVGETYPLGPMTIRILEDGSHTGNLRSPMAFTGLTFGTDNRLGAVELIIPPGAKGPEAHWHEMHDETFLITKGTVRFHATGPNGAEDIDAHTGDYVTVPIRSPHTFSNPFDEEARFFNTLTPAFYVNYFKLLSELADGGPLTPEVGGKAMSRYATIPMPKK